MEYLFEIEDAYCSYNQKDAVLEIKELRVPMNKLVFVIGPSGVGKSTILEALGLMNSTAQINNGGIFQFSPSSNGDKISYHGIWNKRDIDISKIRNSYFSFIFQNTELMGNLSPYENAYIPLLLQGFSKADARQKVHQMIQSMNMSTEIDDEREVTGFSIGQRQRLAFVRAITPEFSVLFGDEPTGNLDKPNAYRLMETLKNSIQERSSSAIIVSHDLELAIDFADIIVLIQRRVNEKNPAEKPIGFVDSESVFIQDRKNELWGNGKTKYSHNRIKGYFQKAIE